MTPSRTATADPALTAWLVARRPLYYADGADVALDRPAHVRAASSLAWVPGGLAVIQDDANFIAVYDPVGARTLSIALPAGAGARRQFDTRRGNKRYKLDLEACVAIESEDDTLLVVLGSGSTSLREHVVLVGAWTSEQPDVRVVHVPLFYDALRRETAFAGSQLNVEGAIYLAGRLRLFGRGNGAPRDGDQPVNATCDIDWPAFLAHLSGPDRSPPPLPATVVHYELGTLGAVPLSFTDAAVWHDAVIFSAAAEASPDAIADGRVAGSAIGVIDQSGRTRWAPLAGPSGAPFVGKVEGLVPANGAADQLFVAVDADDPDTASELCTVELHGDWRV